ncbi:U-scoloptoxin(16)-Er13a-like [Dreissena polymorpha]|uniref:Uncharacterized protein n=1 Tax=Dreissena polymorpha TaxID=45954 RepID=A0A9D3YBX4_DREPO|nr:U-scoloptoxin(16)-Er13a-like [Dreissena polymorpha]KAH3695509.1 hypothetical protein DPMN_082969 [Dreissena polymorpha]
MATKFFLLLALIACTYANFFQTGKCPDNRGAGERWNPAGTCMECYCDHQGYGCDSCQPLTPIIGCYPVESRGLAYPECCPRLVCPPITP